MRLILLPLFFVSFVGFAVGQEVRTMDKWTTDALEYADLSHFQPVPHEAIARDSITTEARPLLQPFVDEFSDAAEAEALARNHDMRWLAERLADAWAQAVIRWNLSVLARIHEHEQDILRFTEERERDISALRARLILTRRQAEDFLGRVLIDPTPSPTPTPTPRPTAEPIEDTRIGWDWQHDPDWPKIPLGTGISEGMTP